MERRISECGEDLCTVCSETMKIFATGECDHPICYKCATRMRVLCEHMYCAICRRDLPKVAFTKDFVKFGSLNLKKFKMHQKYNIFFESDTVRMAFFEIQDHRCQICKDMKPFKSFASLREHMKKEHKCFPCDLCVKHIKVFSSERKFYDRKALATHRRNGDEDDKSHKGHPLCKFCDERYLDNDELVRHLRKDHYYCHFCDSDGISNQFYGDYSYLRDHFAESHYLCEDGDCQNLQFTNAFRYDLDLKAHIAAMHSKNLKRGMAKAVRTLDVDINLAPRSNLNKFNKTGNKGKGVIGPEDYSEVSSQQSSRGAFGRGRNLRFLRERREKEREEEQMARAITASLNSATHNSVSVVDGTLLKKEPEKPPPEPVPQSDYNQDDFPGLKKQEAPTKAEKSSDSDEDQRGSSSVVGDSLAKKVARSQGLNVQDGSMNAEDFPSLAPGQSKPWIKAAIGPSGWQKSEDFPDLGGAKPRLAQPPPMWTNKNKKQPVQSGNRSSQATTGRIKSGSVSKVGSLKTDAPHAASSNDFPSLNSISFALSKGISTGSASDVLAKYASGGVSTSVQQSNVKVIEAKHEVNHVSSSKTLQASSKDFPSLSSKSGTDNRKSIVTQNAWGPKPKVEKPVEKPEPSEEKSGYLKMKKKSKSKKTAQYSLSSEDSSESLKILQEPEVEPVFKKELVEDKDKGASLTSNTGMESNQKKINAGKKKSKPLKDELLKDQLNIVDSAENSDTGSQNSKAPGKNKSKSSKKTREEKGKGKASQDAGATKLLEPKESTILKSTENVTKTEVVQDNIVDFPSIHDTQTDTSIVPVMSANQTENHQPQVNVVNEDDFPVLGGLNISNTSPPPGFIKSTVPTKAAPPPGFSFVPSSNKKNPPPGFSTKPAAKSDLAGIALLLSSGSHEKKAEQVPVVNTDTVESQKVPAKDAGKEELQQVSAKDAGIKEPNQQPAENIGKPGSNGHMTEVNNYSYITPEDFSSRNHKLISDIVSSLEDDQDKFMLFKTLSSDFRKGRIAASDYYSNCSEVIGEEKFISIFSELLVLLPDIEKQQNLLSVHRARVSRHGQSGKKKKGWNVPKSQDFTVCSVCEQVLLPREASGHLSKHNEDHDFPMLGAS